VGFRFFGGKGGVGKTTCAAAWAIGRAEAGGRVLVASTDPAHSLGDALGVEVGGEAVEVVEGLVAVEVAGAEAWRRWVGERWEGLVGIAERGSLLGRDEVERLLGLPMPGADELVGLLEVVRRGEEAGCREVVVDTAPTGHMLRLLASPEVLRRLGAVLAAVDERHRVLAETFGGGAGEPEAVLARLEAEAAFLGELLRDPARSRFSWVTLAQAMAVAEARDAFAALGRQGVEVAEVVVNRWSPRRAGAARRADEAAALRELAALAPGAPFRTVPELDEEPRGVDGLRPVAASLGGPARSGSAVAAEAGAADVGGESERRGRSEGAVEGSAATEVPWRLEGGLASVPGRKVRQAVPFVAADAAAPAWLDEIAPPGLALLFVGGKGGVGKTTCAATVALAAAAARPGRAVRLVSVDPAHSLADVLGQPLGDDWRPVAGAAGDLAAREVDAPAAWERLRGRFAGDLDRLLGWGDGRVGGAATVDREMVRRLLEATPPGLDELVALVEIAELTGEAAPGAEAAGRTPGSSSPPFVVVDTAPTGHALRLLEMPALALDWVRALMAILLDLREALGLGRLAEELVALSRRLKAFQALAGDSDRCRFLLVTRGGELPRRESERLTAALGRLGLALAGVVDAAVADAAAAQPSAASQSAAAAAPGAVPAAAASPGLREAISRPAMPASQPRRVLRLAAPEVFPPPRGVEALLAWGAAWRRAPPEDPGRAAP
jgi:arsenite/tail-anchored protein-transporting ATPase